MFLTILFLTIGAGPHGTRLRNNDGNSLPFKGRVGVGMGQVATKLPIPILAFPLKGKEQQPIPILAFPLKGKEQQPIPIQAFPLKGKEQQPIPFSVMS
jgi:hypothetical protein